MIINM